MNAELVILIADDDPLTRTALGYQLDFLGYQVDYVKDGFEVLAALAKKHYQLLIIDMHMGATDGLSTTLAIRENIPADTQPYIAILTGGVTKDELDALNEAGIDFLIEKPVSIYNLKQLVERAAAKAAISATEPGTQRQAHTDELLPEGIDFQVLNELLNLNPKNTGNETADFLELFFQTTPGIMEKILDTFHNRQSAELKGSLHALRSSSELFGAKRLSHLCKELEKEIERGEAGSISERVDAIASEYKQVSAILRAFQSSGMMNS